MDNSGTSNKNDYLPFIAWLMASFLLMLALEASDSFASSLAPFADSVLRIASAWNQKWPFNTPSAKAHTAIFVLLIPVQIVTLYRIPRDRIFIEPQQKGPGRMLVGMIVLALVPLYASVWGLSLAGGYKFLGKSLGVAFVVFMVTMCISSIARAFPIYLEMLSERR